jgi:tol-pal system protein YbgF
LNTRILRAILSFAVIINSAVTIAAERRAPVTEPASTARMEERLAAIEKSLQNQGLLDLLQQIQALQTEVAKLRGQLEINTHELEKLKEQQGKIFSDTDGRLRTLEGQAPAETVTATEPPPLEVMPPVQTVTPAGSEAETALTVENVSTDASATAPGTVTATAPANEVADNPLEAQAEYQAAFTLLKQAQYDQAITAFEHFLARYPDNPYADNAQHWKGEAYYVTRRYNDAINEYMKLISNYPQSQKAPNSLLKIGLCYYELGKPEEGKKTLEELIRTYPGTTEARNAAERLKAPATS